MAHESSNKTMEVMGKASGKSSTMTKDPIGQAKICLLTQK